MTMAVFLERFTLHDSWIKDVVVWPCSGQVTLTIGFDLHWNNTVPGGFDTLLLHFDRVYSQRSMHGPWIQPTINDASSTVLSGRNERDCSNPLSSISAHTKAAGMTFLIRRTTSLWRGRSSLS